MMTTRTNFIMVPLLLCLFGTLMVISTLGSSITGPTRVVASAVKQEEDIKKPVAPLSVFQTLVCGGSARALAQAVTYPMDALRTISQTRKGAKKLSELGAGVLFSGTVQTSLFAFPLGAVQFTVFGNAKRVISSVVGNATGGIKGTAIAIASSACASIASCAVGVPQEILKQRLVTSIYPNFQTAMATIYKTEGFKGFYVGWGPTVARNLPYVVVTFTVFNHWKTAELKRTGKTSLDTKTSLKFGMGASLLGCLASHPFDVLKTRMMTQAASNMPPYTSPLNCVQDIMKTEGVTAFLAGLAPRIAYISPMWGVQFLLNEKFTRFLGQLNHKVAQKGSSGVSRGPSPGPGRSAWVKHKGTVWTVGVPKGRSASADINEQTKLTLAAIDERLSQAGTDKSKIIEATVFLTNLQKDFNGFDKEWKSWLPEGVGASRATVGVTQLANNDKVEIKVTVAT
jgi:solute carrier family 25 S-adenosylmethionine transporter 26